MPKRFDARLVPGILDDKRRWIERTRDRMLAEGRDLSGLPPELPDTIDFLAMGRSYAVSYLDRPGRVSITENGPRLMVGGPREDEAVLLDALRRFTARKAREFLLPRLDRISKGLNLPYEALRVRRQKTRWGSCSGKGTISVNAKLLFLPIELADHLLLHELCHTRHLNHSPRYWALVARHEPEYERLERELSRGGKYVPAWFG
ncbi:SprT family zinc-dependent metalloprotease [Pseudodesulfovibrio sp. zrk46]|uniref:M48 family metallopeptidase n=1 Tax=Pseudodesulfovibrio sp. zrk46 TaxID=2725288 RepID=UPI001FFDCABA|nr:SprT family zinc-dependent metalloprotease [Pseudodesulfovibrio sp. zrk46]